MSILYPDIWSPFVYWSLHLWFTCFDAEVSRWRDVCIVMLRCGINVRDYLWPPRSPLFIFTSAAAYPLLTLHNPVSNNKHWQKFRGGDRKNLITTSLSKGGGREQARDDQSWIPRELDILVNFPNTGHRTTIWQPTPSASNCHNISCVFFYTQRQWRKDGVAMSKIQLLEMWQNIQPIKSWHFLER